MKNRKNIICSVVLVIVLILLWIGCGRNKTTSKAQDTEFTATVKGTLQVPDAGIGKIPYIYTYQGTINTCANGDYHLKGTRKLELDTDVSLLETEGYGVEGTYYSKSHGRWGQQEKPAEENVIAKENFFSFFGELGSYLGSEEELKIEQVEEGDTTKLQIPECTGKTWQVDRGQFELQDISLVYKTEAGKKTEIAIPDDVMKEIKRAEKEKEYKEFNSAEKEYVFTKEGTYLIGNEDDLLVDVKMPDERFENHLSSELDVDCEIPDLGVSYKVDIDSLAFGTAKSFLTEYGAEIKQCKAKDGREYSYSFMKNIDGLYDLDLRITTNLPKGKILKIEMSAFFDYITEINENCSEDLREEIEKENAEAEEKNNQRKELITEDMVQKIIDNIVIYDE